jgi:F-type H+-transporting ATPase subunit a
MAATGLHISISAEPILYVGDMAISNSIFTSLIVSSILIIFALVVRSKLTNTNKPTGIQNFAEWIIEALHGLIYSTTGSLKKTRLFFPFIASFFLFIILNNWIGLLPGVGTVTVNEPEAPGLHAEVETHEPESEMVVHANEGEVLKDDDHGPAQIPILRPGSADLNTTIALALVSVIMTQVFGVQFQHLGYFKKYINFSSPIMFFVGILELVSEFAKIISFAFRLFGNIFAGEVLLVVMGALVPLIVPMPFYGLELFVGFIQALVFSMLTLVFFNMATQGHDNH